MKICPVCGSEKITYGIGWTTAAIYECKNCGYSGALIIEDDDGKLMERLKEEYEKNKNRQ